MVGIPRRKFTPATGRGGESITDSNALTIEQEASPCSGVTTALGRFGAVAFWQGKREIGYLHRDRIADLPVTQETPEALLAKGRARPHRADVKGYVSYPIQNPEEVSMSSRSLATTTTARRRSPKRRRNRAESERY